MSSLFVPGIVLGAGETSVSKNKTKQKNPFFVEMKIH